MTYAFLVLGIVIGWALAMYRMSTALLGYLHDDAPDVVVELAEDLFRATVPSPLRRLIERHVERKHQ